MPQGARRIRAAGLIPPHRLPPPLCPQALSNIGVVLSELADAPPGSGHTRTLAKLRALSEGGGGGGGGGPPASPRPVATSSKGKDKQGDTDRPEYIKAEYVYAWSQMQVRMRSGRKDLTIQISVDLR